MKNRDKKLHFAPYTISKDGKRVVNLISGNELKQHLNGSGYLQVYLTLEKGKGKWYRVHRLVAMMYVQNPNLYPDVNHKDGNKMNNHWKNLEWVTKSQNSKHAYDAGLRVAPVPMLGKKHSDGAKRAMRDAKVGERHPKFKGWYLYEGKEYASLGALASDNGFYSMKAHRLFKKGLISFRSV